MTAEVRGTARARIVGWMLLPVGLALAGSVAVTWSVLSARLDDRVDGELTHEANKLRSYSRNTVDPAMGRPPGERVGAADGLPRPQPPRRLRDVLLHGGRAERRSAQPPPGRLDRDPAFAAGAARARTPAYGTAPSAAGEVRYAVLPVRMSGDPRQAAGGAGRGAVPGRAARRGDRDDPRPGLHRVRGAGGGRAGRLGDRDGCSRRSGSSGRPPTRSGSRI